VSECYHDKTKTPDRNDLKLGTVLHTVSKPIDFGFRRSMFRVTVSVGLLPADQKYRNAAGVTEYNSM